MTDNYAGTTTESTESGNAAAVSTGNQPDYKVLYNQTLQEATEWKNRFNGLQGTYQREQQKWKSDTAALTETKSALDAITAEKTGLQAQLEEFTSKLGIIEAEKEIHAANLERMKIVVSEFPQLTPFLAKGLIPDETGEELRNKLKELEATIAGVKSSALEEFRAGGSLPQPPKPKTEIKKSDIQAQLFEAFKTGNTSEYDRLYNELLKSGGPNG